MQNIPIIPPGYASVAPWIIGKDTVRLMSFLSEAFDAEDLGSFQNPDGSIGHAEMRIGNTIILMFDMRDWPPTPAFLQEILFQVPLFSVKLHKLQKYFPVLI